MAPVYLPAVRAAIEEALSGGVLAGYPIVDIAVTVVGGTYDETLASEAAFNRAAALRFKRVRAAQPVLLEPVMR